LSSSDHPEIEELVTRCAERFEDRDVDVSLPSLRVSDQLRFLAGPLSNVRKSSVTVAPEAGTQRLRSVINKDITEEDLMDGVRAAYEAGWQHVKLYFMIGLPTEKEEDVRAIAHLCDRVSDLRREVETKPGKVNVSVAPFVPKAHTPFQWEPMADLDYLQDMQSLLLDEIENNRVRFKFHTPERSVIEGLLARGDRRLGDVIKDVWQQGGQLEAWDEFFQPQRWRKAMERNNLDPDFYVSRERPKDERLPWEHISFGLSRDFLWAEAQRARKGEMTPDCRREGCTGCGVCESVE
ncbi:MAG: radical SAM protein, partial [Planctomycetota bacterium]